ncbi:MAG: hypothetical protein A3G25_00910 [Betaproteobacteria bacterium RIFCSPLOWO2_12_FULL_63_13]|nr:MAG: hypothetical protein A3H32_20870 [Betaproteobacteria bacterium RIFCSPLOWO2_02_FULL_63_19]OGA50106.1 MAG: hypothetical protein A3G25_00910 [Betaproteobacteria bacterium RIFCSPLOWO2_12_FULL_63_13]
MKPPLAPILEARAVAKSFGAVQALRDVSFAVAPGEVRGICGENGAGKSTLIKILTGVHQSDRGTIVIDGAERRIEGPLHAQALGIAFVSQELSIAPHLSVEDNIWLGHRDVPLLHRRRALRQRAREVLELVGLRHLAVDVRASTLSLGERQLLEIARMLVRNARVLILDEPTATLSDREIAQVFATLRRLKQQGRTIIFITHRLAEIFEICDSVTVLRNGYEVGSYATSEVDRTGLIEAMLGRPLEQMYPQAPSTAGGPALVVRDLHIPGSVRSLSFVVPQGCIACLVGQIGSGATEAVRALAGLVYTARGEASVGGRPLRFGSVPKALARNVRFVSEERAAEGVFLNLSVRENLLATQLDTLGAGGWMSRQRLTAAAGRLAGMVGIDGRRLRSRTRELSGGNQQKVAVGRSVTSHGTGVLLMNEPTRGVDVGARAEIYVLMRRLCNQGYAILMTSADIEEVVGMSDIVVTMYRGAKVAEYAGDAIDRTRVLSDIIQQQTAMAGTA